MSTYRARIDEGPRCRFHKLAPGSETCARCGASICDVCATFATSHVACSGCAAAIGRARNLKRAGIVIGLVAAFAAMGFGLSRVTFAKQQAAADAAALEKEMDEAGGCYEDRTLHLLHTLHDARMFRREIERIDAYLATGCPSFLELVRQRRAALDADGDDEAAARVATELIANDPRDKDYWWWRAESYEKLGRLEEAAADYEQCLALSPQITDIPERLAHVYERIHRPCDAIGPLAQLLYYRSGQVGVDRITPWASGLATSDACKPLAVHGTALFAFPPGDHGVARAEVRLDGKGPGTFEAATAQSVSLISRAFAERIGLPTDGPMRRVHTAGGLQEARMATAGLVSAGGVEAPRVAFAVVDRMPEGVDGVLGLSFLLRFRVVPTPEGLRLAPPPLGVP